MSNFRSIILIALLVGQATAFMTAGTESKSLTSLESYNNRNYGSAGGYGNERYGSAGGYGNERHMEGGGGMRRYNNNDYDRRGNSEPGYNNRYGTNDYNRGGYNSYDRGYGGMGGGGMSRSKFGDWMNGSSNYIPTSADRNYVMDRGYETNGRYSNYYNNGDRYNTRFNGGGYGTNNNSMNRGQYGSMNTNMASGQYGNMNNMNGGQYNRGYNEYDRYSPVGYSNNNRYGSYNRENNPRYEGNFRTQEYERTYRSPMDSHRQEYPSYSMGRMQNQFGSQKWWDSN